MKNLNLVQNKLALREFTGMSDKKSEIVNLVNRFRFLNRIQIQRILNHKYHNRVNLWLKDLVEEEYLGRIYNKNLGENRKPSIYYLKKNGIDYLLDNLTTDNKLLKKSLENKRSEEKISFLTINHSIKAAEFYLILRNYAQVNRHILEYYTETDLISEPFNRLLKPDGYFLYSQNKGTEGYFVEIDLETSTRETFRKKLIRYLEYYFSEKWKEQFREFPQIAVVCITQKRLESLLKDASDLLEQYGFPEVIIKFSTFERIERFGVNSETWDNVIDICKLL